MDKVTLLSWKTELEKRLADAESKIIALQSERLSVSRKLENIEALISSLEEPIVGEGTSDVPFPQPLATRFFQPDSVEVEVKWNDVLATFNSYGWSVNRMRGRKVVFEVKKGSDRKLVWRRYSKHHETQGDYWFGINKADLGENAVKEGGVILLLLGLDYVYFPFAKLSELLARVRPSKIGNALFHIKASEDNLHLYPSGTCEWIDVTKFRGIEGLKRLLE